MSVFFFIHVHTEKVAASLLTKTFWLLLAGKPQAGSVRNIINDGVEAPLSNHLYHAQHCLMRPNYLKTCLRFFVLASTPDKLWF